MNPKLFKSFIFVGLILITTLSIMGCKKQVQKTAETANQKVNIKQVVEAFGVIKARDYKDINLDFPAQILSVPVKNGQHIKMKEPLVYLNINNFMAMIKNKEYELNSARFELEKTAKRVQDAQEVYERAKHQLEEQGKLLKEGAISQNEMDNFRDQVKEKEKAVTDIKLSIGHAKGVSLIDIQAERIGVLEYDLKRLKDKLNQSFLQGNVIVSDYSNAVVYDINCAAGYSVSGNESSGLQQKLLSIMNLNSLYISADVAEEFIKDVRIGAAVTILPIADNNRKYYGKVIRIADMAVKQNGETNIAVEISLDKPDGFLRPNFNVDVEIEK